MSAPLTDPLQVPPPPLPAAAAWNPLPARGAWLAGMRGGLTAGLIALLPTVVVIRRLYPEGLWWMLPVAALAGTAAGAWMGMRRHRVIRWCLDADGLALRRGRWWQTETRVPISRVQHLDLKRGPLERAARLSTLVVHTAGTKFNAVAVAGLDAEDAEHLRDRLARQLDQDGDAL